MALTKEELDKKLVEWKSISTEVPVRLETQLNNSSSGLVYYKEWTAQDKLKRAFKTGGTLWLIAVLAVFLPLVHFVLVPLFLIAGPIGFAIMLNRENVILGGVANCPDCKERFDISKSKVEWPMKDVCSHCYHHITIQKA